MQLLVDASLCTVKHAMEMLLLGKHVMEMLLTGDSISAEEVHS
jgi:hypothetical protein